MKNLEVKKLIIRDLEEKGVDFNKDPFCLNGVEKTLLNIYAKQVHYRKPKNGYFALAGSFFIHLQKIVNK